MLGTGMAASCTRIEGRSSPGRPGARSSSRRTTRTHRRSSRSMSTWRRTKSQGAFTSSPSPVRGRGEPRFAMGEYDIEEIRQKYVGFETAEARGRYPVEYDAIRRHCHMVDDNNPLF